MLLDRPLESSLSDNQAAFPGPTGSFNLAFHPNALALVTRPLAKPDTNSASSAVVSYKGLSIRVTMQYDVTVTGHRVHLDLLAGVAILDPALAVVLLG